MTMVSEGNAARAADLEQSRITRLQVVNWGTFCGYKDFPIDDRGVLFTGPSGSGKSSLMDAHSLALLPSADHRFNASADLTARGAKQGTRSVADYVRGAWSETNDEHEQSQVRYLRGGKPTWSAVAATYSNGLGASTTAVVVKWFTGSETDGASLKTMYQLHDDRFDLTELEEWAQRQFDTRWYKAAHPAVYPDSQGAYMRQLAQRVGLGTSKTALSLLGKAKAMKNVGDLNFFIRSNMLDDPDTFQAAQKMLDAFTPLNDSYETARRAHRQAQVLREVPASWVTYCESDRTRTLAEAVLGPPIDHYLRTVHLRVLQEEMDRLDDIVAGLDEQLVTQDEHSEIERKAYVSLDEQLRRESQALQELQVRLDAANNQTSARESAYRIYGGHVVHLGRLCPQDESAFTALRAQLPQMLGEAQAGKEALKPQRHALFAAAGEASKRHEATTNELLALQAAATLIPPAATRRREIIAQGAGVPISELPYAAELIDIAEDEEEWRPAAEKVLRSYGLRLLVTDQHRNAVARFIDEHDMRGIVEYSIVTAVSAHQPRPSPDTLAGKLIIDTEHPSGPWLATQIARRFEHVCVRHAADLEPRRIAVTVRGTVKMPGNNYRKDDRPELTNPSSYILGANTAAKRAALEADLVQLAQGKAEATTAANELDERYQNFEVQILALTQLTGYTSWTELDYWSSAHLARDLEERITAIKAENVNLQHLETQRDEPTPDRPGRHLRRRTTPPACGR